MEYLELLKSLLLSIFTLLSGVDTAQIEAPVPQSLPPAISQEFKSQGLTTDTSIHSIDLSEVLDGGPGKDGIPAIDSPTFISILEASEIEDEETEGLAVSINGEHRFYPYTILVWHEVVNDTVGGKDISVTFCPLCGSGIVFDRSLDSGVTTFGVSGLLWESNLLMYDRATETLWSQAKGEAVVGQETGEKLIVLDSDLISFDAFAEKYPTGKILSRKTGNVRAYGFYPYGDYEENDTYIFPVSNTDTRFDGKELMYIVPLKNGSAAFPRAALLEAGGATLDTPEGQLKATVDAGSITVLNNNLVLPGYHEMWFSWATHHSEDGVVWSNN